MAKLNNLDHPSGSQSLNDGWHTVAWAFLKPFPRRNKPGNVEKKLRLQLHKPNELTTAINSEGKKDDPALAVWDWWKSKSRAKYPSSLYVTVQAVLPPDKPGTQRATNPKDPLLQPLKSTSSGGTLPKIPRWSRIPGQTCKVPTEKFDQMEMTQAKTTVVKFSPDGRHLACAVHKTNGHGVIEIYDISGLSLKQYFSGHQGIIYDLDWTMDGGELVSVSGDRTARLWTIATSKDNHDDDDDDDDEEILALVKRNHQLLQHPSFVYCVAFHPKCPTLLATGCFDKVIRTWKRVSKEEQLLSRSDELVAEEGHYICQELVGHDGHISSLLFDSDGQMLYSGDQKGKIKLWENVSATATTSSMEKTRDRRKNSITSLSLLYKKTISLEGLENSLIQSLILHPGGKRLLIFSSSLVAPLITIDLRQNSVMQSFPYDENGSRGILRHHACISPCGTYLFAGENEEVKVWNVDTAEQMRTYPMTSVCCLSFHPFENMLAMGNYESEEPGMKIFSCTKGLGHHFD